VARAGAREARAHADHPPRGQFVQIDGRRVHAVVQGRGPDLVLIHGASGNLHEFDELAERLAPRFRTFALDRPGLGHSDGLDLADNGLVAQARHLSRAAWALGARNPLVLGHSYGGSVAMAWALEGDLDLAGLLLLSAPTMPWDGRLDIWYRLTRTEFGIRHAIPAVAGFMPDFWLRRMVDEVFAPEPVPPGYFAAKGIALAIRRETLRHNTSQINRLLDDIRSQQHRHRHLDLPIEILHGTEDRVVPIHMHSRLLAPRLAGARLTELPGAGHMPHLTRAAQVEAALLRLAARAGLPFGA
jgi:pimeloyl-ACP methyl ester carboxylesterase